MDVLVADLRRLGVRSGDLLMVHASLRSIGPVAGGAGGVLDAVGEAIGPDGTLLVNVGVRDDWAWVNDRPEHERGALLADSPTFDASTTPADPENGVLAEVFRRRPGVVPSDHPEGRFAALGPLADELVGDVPWHDYYGADSPLGRFTRKGGRVLRLGADIDTVTLVHLAENLVELPAKRRVVRHRRVAGPDGRPVVRTVSTIDDSDGIAAYPGDYFTELMQEYLASGRARRGTVGAAPAELLEAPDLIEFAVSWLADHLGRTSTR